MKKDKKKKKNELDDYSDLTVANMNVEGMPWYKDPNKLAAEQKIGDLNLSKKEKRALILGAYRAFLPVFLIIIGVFCVCFTLLMLYMKASI